MREKYRQLTLDQYLSLAKGRDEVHLKFWLKQIEGKEEDIDNIISTVADENGITSEEILGSSRRKDITHARFVAAHFLYTTLGLSLRTVAICLGRSDHTTTINALDHIQTLMESDSKFKQELESHPLSKKLSSNQTNNQN